VKLLRYSLRAEADLDHIADYTEGRWGLEQSVSYIKQLGACAELVFKRPGIARACDYIRAGYLRMEEGRHVLLFKPDAQGLLVVRVLYEGMLPELHVADSDEDEDE
jgi:toxin ParE1/3/4